MANRRESERQVDELQALVAALNAQIQGIQVQLEVREKEIRELSKKVEDYRAKESAIVAAMTDTQEACLKRVQEAEIQAKKIIAVAEDKARQVEAESCLRVKEREERAISIENDAKARAKKIVDNAENEANEKIAEVGREAEGVRARIDKLNQSLESAVAQAKAQAENFEDSLKTVSSDMEGIKLECDELFNLLPEKQKAASDEPESNAAGLYLYKQESGSSDVAPEVETERESYEINMSSELNGEPEEERVWTVDEIIAGQREFSGENISSSTDVPAKLSGAINVDDLLDKLID